MFGFKSNNYRGINEDKLLTISQNMDKSVMEVDKLHDDITVFITNSKDSFNSKCGKKFESVYNNFSYNYQIVKNNLLCYSSDFRKIIKSYTKLDDNEAKRFKFKNKKMPDFWNNSKEEE